MSEKMLRRQTAAPDFAKFAVLIAKSAILPVRLTLGAGCNDLMMAALSSRIFFHPRCRCAKNRKTSVTGIQWGRMTTLHYNNTTTL